MEPILQSHIPFDTSSARLPGAAPLAEAEWLIQDDAFAAQMALRDSLIATRRAEVIALEDRGREAADELLAHRLFQRGDAGYVEGFQQYATDLETVFSEVALPDCRPPYFIVAHSTGHTSAIGRSQITMPPEWIPRWRGKPSIC